VSSQPVWQIPTTFTDAARLQKQAAAVVYPEWMSEADKQMTRIEDKQPVPWELFCDQVRASHDLQFAILEQWRFEECPALPSPNNDVIIDSAEVVWSEHYIGVLKSCGKHDYPIAVTGAASEHVLRNLPGPSQVILMPETPEVHGALKVTSDIMTYHWDSRTYFSIPKWKRLIQTSISGGIEIRVREFDEIRDADRVKMRMVAI
jgi:hypothetical protein